MMKAPILTERIRVDHGFGTLYALAFHPHGNILASGGEQRDTSHAIKLWHAATGQELSRFGSHAALVWSVAFSPDGTILASGSQQGLTLWDIGTGRAMMTVSGTGPIMSVAFSPDGQLVAAVGLDDDHAVALWDVTTGREVQHLVGHTAAGLSVAFSPDGMLVASGSRPPNGGRHGMLRLWEVATGTEVLARSMYRGASSVAFSQAGRLLAVGDGHGYVSVIDLATGHERYTLFGPTEHVANALAFSPTDERVLAGAFGEDYAHPGAVMVWTLGDSYGHLFTGVTDAIMNTVAISSDGTTLAAGGMADLWLWDLS